MTSIPSLALDASGVVIQQLLFYVIVRRFLFSCHFGARTVHTLNKKQTHLISSHLQRRIFKRNDLSTGCSKWVLDHARCMPGILIWATSCLVQFEVSSSIFAMFTQKDAILIGRPRPIRQEIILIIYIYWILRRRKGTEFPRRGGR